MMARGWLLASLTLLACDSETLTETVIVIDAEGEIRARADHTTLVVTRDPEEMPVQVHSDVSAPRPAHFPYVVVLSPSGDTKETPYRVEVTALERGKQLAVARLVSGYVAHQRRYIQLWLEDACLDALPCDPNETCRAGTCVSATRDPSALADGDQVTIDEGPVKPARDAGPDTRPERDAPAVSRADAAPSARVNDAGSDAKVPGGGFGPTTIPARGNDAGLGPCDGSTGAGAPCTCGDGTKSYFVCGECRCSTGGCPANFTCSNPLGITAHYCIARANQITAPECPSSNDCGEIGLPNAKCADLSVTGLELGRFCLQACGPNDGGM